VRSGECFIAAICNRVMYPSHVSESYIQVIYPSHISGPGPSTAAETRCIRVRRLWRPRSGPARLRLQPGQRQLELTPSRARAPQWTRSSESRPPGVPPPRRAGPRLRPRRARAGSPSVYDSFAEGRHGRHGGTAGTATRQAITHGYDGWSRISKLPGLVIGSNEIITTNCRPD
jgi:hypothetical protein